MELVKRIRVAFRDDDILSESQKLEGLSRSWILLEPHQHDAVSDVASYLLHTFQLEQSCPHGLLLSISGFVLPPFLSTRIIKDSEIISVRRRKDMLSIEGNNAANDVQKLKALEKQPVNSGFMLLANEEFEKEKGGYESDDPEKESADDDAGLLEVVETSSRGNSNKKNCKRKAADKLEGYKEKKQRSQVTGNASSNGHKKKKDSSVAEDDVENGDEPAEQSDKDNVSRPGMERTVDVQEKDKEADDAKSSPKETKKVASRSARRKTKKRLWLREMAKIQKQNATCESEGLRNWKEDQAKADRKKSDGQWNGQKKWKKYQADTERNEEGGQPKGLLHWKLSSQNNGVVKGKRHKQHKQNDDFLELPNQNGDICKKQNQNGDTHEQPNQSLHEQSGRNGAAVKELSNQNASEQSNHKSEEEKEFVPIEIRPGHIRFAPLEEEEAMQQDHAPLETFNWNGITSKKKGQQWGKENRKFTPRNDCRADKEDSETLTKEKEKHSNERIDFDKLPMLTGLPKKGDLIAYQILELSSTWTPELSYHRVGKVSWYNSESNQIMLLPVPEYPIFPEKDDCDEAVESDNSLYKEDGSLEIDFSSLIDARVLSSKGISEPGNEPVARVSEASTGNVNDPKTALTGISCKPTSEPTPGSHPSISIKPKQAIPILNSLPSADALEPNQGKEIQPPTAENGGSVWDQLSNALNAKKEQLSKENDWTNTPKKVAVSYENNWGKNGKKLLPSSSPSDGSKGGKSNTQKPQENSWGKQSTGSKSWSYRALRGSALGPTMAMLRSKNDA